MRIVNVDHLNGLPGGVGCEHDNAVVVSETEREPHIITGQMQPRCLFRGTLAEAHEFVRQARAPFTDRATHCS